MTNIKMYDKVEVIWVDPQFLELRGLSYQEDLDGINLQKCSIMGHLVKETKDTYFIAKEVWECGAFKYIHMIPKKIVEEFRILREAKNGSRKKK